MVGATGTGRAALAVERERRAGPRVSRISCCSSQVCIPPMPDPISTPTRSRFSSVIWSCASRSASSVAASANCTKRSQRLSSLPSIQSVGLKSRTSPAIRTSYWLTSNCVIGPIPDRPSQTACQNSSGKLPTGVIMPTPVMTTRLFLIMDGYRAGHLIASHH